MNFIVLGLNHRTAPVEIRELFAIPAAGLEGALQGLVGRGTIREAAIVSTCNRVEIYAAGLDLESMRRTLEDFLAERAGGRRPAPGNLYLHALPQSATHLYEVCGGLDSMVVGETEILGQVKEAYRRAQEAHRTGLALNKAFQGAFAVAKEIRSTTRIGMGSVSVGSVAADLAAQIFGDLGERTVLLMGAGEMAEATARALKSRGAGAIRVANRSPEKAEALASEFGGQAVPWEGWIGECRRVDIVITSTSAPHALVRTDNLGPAAARRGGVPLFLIDIAVPRNIEREVSSIEGVYLYDIDDLQLIAEQNLAVRQQEITVCRQIIRDRADEFTRWFKANTTQIARCPTARKLLGAQRPPPPPQP